MIATRPCDSYDARGGDGIVDMLVLHYTGMASGPAALERLCDPDASVSAHYIIDEAGHVVRIVEEHHRAWHAGVAFWRGETDINARSIGIELVNPGHDFGYRPFAAPQMAALIELAGDILDRHPIPARNVVGHSDVAPSRKMDPGELFDWPRLAAAGIGLWPAEDESAGVDPAAVEPKTIEPKTIEPKTIEPKTFEPEAVIAMLGRFGYATADRFAAIRAFQRHFRPARVNGRIDFETVRRLVGLLALCGDRP